jgi:hypothetical protein
MTISKNHHFVPRLLLRQWANDKDQVQCWHWKDAKIESFSPATENIMAETRLYKAQHIDNPSIYEDTFNRIETNAARVLEKLCNPKGPHLVTEDFHAWSLFILAQRARTPAKIAWAKQQAYDMFINEFEKPDLEFNRLNVDERFSTPAHYMNEHHPNVLANFHFHTTMKIIFDEKNVNAMGRLKWFVRDKYARPLIISDDPVTFKGRLREEDCLIALPISPYQVFFAVSDDRIRDRILSEGDKSAAARVNHDQALQAQRFVVGDVEPCFLEKRLRKQPEPYAPTDVSSRRDVR